MTGGLPFDVFMANRPSRAKGLEEVAAGLGDAQAVESAAVVSEVSGDRPADPTACPISAGHDPRPPSGWHSRALDRGGRHWTTDGHRRRRPSRASSRICDIDISGQHEVHTESETSTRFTSSAPVVAFSDERDDRHIIVTLEGAARLEAESKDPRIVVRLVDGTDMDLIVKHLINTLYGVERLAPPAAIDNLDELVVLQAALALTVGALGIAAIAHASQHECEQEPARGRHRCGRRGPRAVSSG